jgi:hypothetical protein
MATELQRKLSHSRAAYLFAVGALPSWDPRRDGLVANGFRFSSASQIESMLIELGGAFFCRYEACVEDFLRENGVQLSKTLSLGEWMEQHGVPIPDAYREPLAVYRRIRNHLHHEDGGSLDRDRTHEIHLLPAHMENFYNFFVWVGESVASTQGAAQQGGAADGASRRR